MPKFNVSYDLIYAGLVEVEADDEDDAAQEVISWPLSKLLQHTSGGEFVQDSINVSPGAPDETGRDPRISIENHPSSPVFIAYVDGVEVYYCDRTMTLDVDEVAPEQVLEYCHSAQALLTFLEVGEPKLGFWCEKGVYDLNEVCEDCLDAPSHHNFDRAHFAPIEPGRLYDCEVCGSVFTSMEEKS